MGASCWPGQPRWGGRVLGAARLVTLVAVAWVLTNVSCSLPSLSAAERRAEPVDWENLIYLFAGAALARPVWPVIRGLWVWLVALCLARHIRLNAMKGAVPRRAPLYAALYGWASSWLYPNGQRTQARDDAIQDAIWDTEERHRRRHIPRASAFDVSLVTAVTAKGREMEAQRVREHLEERKKARRLPEL